MKWLLLTITLIGLGLLSAQPLPRATPESQGLGSGAIEALVHQLETIEAVHSFMVLRHGNVVAEGWWHPYVADRRHKFYSLSKSFTSTAVGMVIAEGKLSLDDTVLSFFPEDAPTSPNDNLKNMRVRDLLCMSTGHVNADLDNFSFTDSQESLTKTFLHLPVTHKPGTHFLYNTPATYMCSAIVQKVTDMSTHDYLKKHLFGHLGIVDTHWETCHAGISLGGFGFNAKTEDIAKLGQLYLQQGEWEGKRLLQASWVAAATGRQTSNGSNPNSDWDQGYGYQFWQCRHGAYRGDGAFGQFCIVFPQHDTVVAITSGTGDMQGVMTAVWAHLLPAFAPVPLPENAEAHAALTKLLSTLKLPSAPGEPLETQITKGRYVFPRNTFGIDEVRFDSEDKEHPLIISIGGQHVSMDALGMTLNRRLDKQSAADPDTSLAWLSPKTLVSQTYYTRSPYALTLELTFDEKKVRLDPKWNVSFGPKKLVAIEGSLSN